MKKLLSISSVAGLLFAATAAAYGAEGTLFVTASNATANQLLVYDSTATLIQTVATGGKGGVSGNSGGIAAEGDAVAVVNFGSKTVSIFQRAIGGFKLKQTIPTSSSPVSVAIGNGHLYTLGTTTVESHLWQSWFGNVSVNASSDGLAGLVLADGSAAQVGVVTNGLVITEKTGVIETVGVSGTGAVSGAATLVSNIPSNPMAPFGLVTRGNNAYVTIAHSDEISLVRNGTVLATTPTSSFAGPTQHAPCWVTLEGPYLFSSNSPSHSISLWAVYGQNIVPDVGVAATLNGAPTDIAVKHWQLVVIDGAGSASHLSIFSVDEDGNLTIQGSATMGSGANGVAIIEPLS